jgi:dienelactone hydrolase
MKFALLIGYLLIGGCAADSGLKIPSEIPFSRYSSTLSGDLRLPDGDGPFPTVVLMHGCDGLKTVVRQGLNRHATFLNEHGYATLVLDSFSSRGKQGGGVCNSNYQLGRARDYRTFDAFNTLRFLKQQKYVDSKNIFLIGQSNGGSVAYLVSKGGREQGFPDDLTYNAIVAFYPWCSEYLYKISSPLLILSGEKDEWTPVRRCLAQKDIVKGKEYRIVVFPDVYHSFDLQISLQTYSGHLVGGNISATKESRRLLLEFFEKYRI